MSHTFTGKWITDEEFCSLTPRNVFHRQLESVSLPCEEHRNRHILFRRCFICPTVQEATVYLSADDYYHLYINGKFVAMGPTPAYHFQYNYNTVDVTPYLTEGENVIAVHTLYQGLINRVWQSGDGRHGLILDLCVNGETLVASDESFKTHPHTGYTEVGTSGYETQFLERYDSAAPEVGFEQLSFDDSGWAAARLRVEDDHVLTEQASEMLTFEEIVPAAMERLPGRVICDFGSNYVGYLRVTARGKAGDTVTVRCAQEREADGSLRYRLRANCVYEEPWVLAEGESTLQWFDYKAFRYAELLLPEGVEILTVSLTARHYPFALRAELKAEYAEDAALRRVWDLCVHTQRYGVQEVIQDCMEREKGFYLGDGCYTALTHMVLTGNDSMVRRLIDDAFSTVFITDTLVTCMNCSFMQEIAEYPLILVFLVLWHYRLTGDAAYLAENYPKVTALLEAYRRDYESEGLLRRLDKWCVVEWPANFQDGYDVDIREGKVCEPAHVALNAYYLEAVATANRIAARLGLTPYREEAPLRAAFAAAFYVPERRLCRDGEGTEHMSLVGNAFAYAYGLLPQEAEPEFLALLRKKGLDALSFFATFPLLQGLTRRGEHGLVREILAHEGTWQRMLREDATTTFEGWGKECKWNTSLFHLTMSYAAVFLTETPLWEE